MDFILLLMVSCIFLKSCKIQVLLSDCRDEESIGEFKGFGKIIDIGSNIK